MKEIRFELGELPNVAEEFIKSIGDDRIFLFEGEMGSGKTTLISEICRILGSKDDFGSPTFSLVNEYSDKDGNPIFHFDLYRVESSREAWEMGAEEYFDSGSLCFVEWPDRLGDLMPENARIVEIRVNDDDSRTIKF